MPESTERIYGVGELTQYIKHLLEHNPVLVNVEVTGEVSNLTYHNSGHVYFTLKDPDAQLSCVMFKSYAQQAQQMKAGDKVIVKGGISIYAPRGNYQLLVRTVRKQGVGDLFQKFMELKQKLQDQGLFDPVKKKQLPFLPHKIAVITSPTGAAVRDILRTLKKRYDRAEVIVIPTVVQGTQGQASIIRSIQLAEAQSPDVIILGRGGGSLEDLWNFNEELVARAIFDCNIPIITGIGHETDFTIADFVADLRASTPTAAAMQAVPEKEALVQLLKQYQEQMEHSLRYFIDFKRQVLDDYQNRLQQAALQQLQQKRHEIALLDSQLKGTDMRALLKRGYTLTLQKGKILSSATGLKKGDQVETVFTDGRVGSTVDG